MSIPSLSSATESHKRKEPDSSSDLTNSRSEKYQATAEPSYTDGIIGKILATVEPALAQFEQARKTIEKEDPYSQQVLQVIELLEVQAQCMQKALRILGSISPNIKALKKEGSEWDRLREKIEKFKGSFLCNLLTKAGMCYVVEDVVNDQKVFILFKSSISEEENELALEGRGQIVISYEMFEDENALKKAHTLYNDRSYSTIKAQNALAALMSDNSKINDLGDELTFGHEYVTFTYDTDAFPWIPKIYGVYVLDYEKKENSEDAIRSYMDEGIPLGVTPYLLFASDKEFGRYLENLNKTHIAYSEIKKEIEEFEAKINSLEETEQAYVKRIPHPRQVNFSYLFISAIREGKREFFRFLVPTKNYGALIKNLDLTPMDSSSQPLPMTYIPPELDELDFDLDFIKK